MVARCSVCTTHVYRMGVVDASADRITFDKDVAHDNRSGWLDDNRDLEVRLVKDL